MLSPEHRKKIIIRVPWGDGAIIEIVRPKLDAIPGESVVCPTPCNPFGDEPEWGLKNERATRKSETDET